MRSVTVVGAGQAGMPLALALQAHGYQVRVVTDRSAAAVESGPVLSSQGMQSAAVEMEHGLGVDFWTRQAPSWEGLTVTLAAPGGGIGCAWTAPKKAYGESIDHRLKLSGWLRVFAYRGGEVVVRRVTVDVLEDYARASDLVVVSAGRGELAELFARNERHSPFDRPQRALALAYLDGVVPRIDFTGPGVTVVPGVGEIVVFPALTLEGNCEIVTMEGVPGGPLDCWAGVGSPSAHLARTKEVLKRFAPWEGARCADAILTDDRGWATGSVTPVVREPVGVLPSGRPVLGMGDSVVLNDPVTGQGANNAVKAAMTYLRAILDREDQPFDVPWMRATFAEHWEVAKHSTRFTNTMLAPPPHVVEIMAAGARHPEVADRVATGFDRPQTLAPWFFDAAAAGAYLDSVAQDRR
ncbi:styrene monooxygenase/indole monooxygenase family protein [Actinokineospora sp. 24-640]